MAQRKKRRGGYPPRVPGKPANRQLNMRVTEAEYERLERAAAAAGETLSDFVRKAIEQRAKRYKVNGS